MRKWCLLFALFTSAACAQCLEKNTECVSVNEWEVSLALGYGELSNPLHGGDNISLILLPSISYYGENIFFEKTTLGYAFYQDETFAISGILQPNRENAFFSRWHVNNIFTNSFVSESAEFIGDEREQDHKTPVSINVADVEKRKWALDGGFQLNWFIDPAMQFQAKILHDVNAVYNGWNGQLSLNRAFRINQNLSFNAGLGVFWLSAEQSHYYYGIDWQDNLPSSVYYQGKSSINSYVKLKANYQLSTDWAITASVYREFIDDNIEQSPLVQESTIESFYLGVVYAF
ncbi:MAG: MipA/OmpV family protein [Thalassotalea sp.]